ncbi:hypothetical protein EPUS_07591 [Endocarpon pusillum Z07020]|uniref:Uncharacterized protein n=1 Tax=Endocarpon pusillum (strain Z07020 / HMAS-L-300199) TaxID=1263415 RepID=U1HHX0_ENDPU|nr:uncharacterized protein EPUS_07591 [Endocarpon pusillum Z07020]ERF69765.1 hypothetical protein EPUS_07591 [Endocarpon pusillum Z07020]
MLDACTTSVEQWSPPQKYVRRDADFKHLEALGEASKAIGKKYWSKVTELWNLGLIVTDRHFRRRGATTEMIKRGCARADEEHLRCRVEASPVGRLVYASYGFKELGTWDVKLQRDPASLHMWCMGRDAKY